jgi:hypothetical protein
MWCESETDPGAGRQNHQPTAFSPPSHLCHFEGILHPRRRDTEHRDNEQEQEHDEANLRDRRGDPDDNAEADHPAEYGEDQEYECVLEHGESFRAYLRSA